MAKRLTETELERFTKQRRELEKIEDALSKHRGNVTTLIRKRTSLWKPLLEAGVTQRRLAEWSGVDETLVGKTLREEL